MYGGFIPLDDAICRFVLPFQQIKHKEICMLGVPGYGFVP